MKNSRVTCSNKLYLFHIYVNPINPYPANEPLLLTKTTEYVKSNLFARLKAKVKNLKKESQNIIEASKKSEQILT